MSTKDLFAPSSDTRRLSVQLNPEDLKAIGMKEDDIQTFIRLRERYLTKPFVDWPTVESPEEDYFHQYSELATIDKAKATELLNKLVVVHLNGGLGSRMEMKGPKSLLQILTRAGHLPLTFLDCKVMHLEAVNNEFGVDVPMVLMNSYSTNEETKKAIEKYKGRNVNIHTFVQSRHPLLFKDTLSPLPSGNSNDPDMWYPPGSGEVFSGLMRSGLLEQFMKAGKEYIFIANVENLGATIDTKLLNHFAASKLDFLVEVTNRISTDESGGMPVKYHDTVHIMETSQVPYDELNRFGISNFKFWNTNNVWAKLKNIYNMLNMNALQLDFIVKYRTWKGRNVLQIETPMAMAIHSFKNAAAIYVPRFRHKPVKNTSQLLMVQSELFDINEKGSLVMNPKRVPATEPLIKLGVEFRALDSYEKRFKTLPNILELDHLTVSGNVTFGADVTLKGTVIVVAETGSRIDIPDGVTLENKIVSGSLVLMDY